MKYSIVIPTYNHCNDLLKPCLESIFKFTNIADVELIISANGCTDETFFYLGSLKEKFNYLGLASNLKIVWSNEALGYAGACNEGIKIATTDYIVLLNNDTLLLQQPRNLWLDLLVSSFSRNQNCGISCIIRSHSEPAGREFAIFFCVMIHRKVFERIGLLNLEYGVGGGEDTEFCIEAENAGFEVCECIEKKWSQEANMFVGDFPLYHKGEGTMHDPTLVPEWNRIFRENSIRLARKYNRDWYKWSISNNSERGVFFKHDPVYPREKTRYEFASNNLKGSKVLELGCSSGFGYQFLPNNVDYLGIDNSPEIITAANEQEWSDNAKFICADINALLNDEQNPFEFYDTIIAFETIEHIPNGLEVVEKLKMYCNKLIITVPYNENPGQFSPHHFVHNLTVEKFKDFTEIGIIDIDGNIIDKSNAIENSEYNLLLVWERTKNYKDDFRLKLKFLKAQHEEIYQDVIAENNYDILPEDFHVKRDVIDIGANIGAFSLLTGYLGARKVLAVEPVSATHEQLVENIKTLKLKNITPIKKVVSHLKNKKHKISLKPNSGHNSLYNVDETYEEVSSIKLTDLMKETTGNHVMLKLDCEGSEYDILLNAKKEDLKRVDRIILEVHADLHPVHKGFDILNEKLIEFGFTQTNVKQIYTWFTDAQGNRHDMKPLPFRVEMWKR